MFLKSSDYLRFYLFLALFVLSPPFVGGAGKIPVFLAQTLILSAFFLYATNLCFYRLTPSFMSYQEVRTPFILFSLFILYVFFQWLGGLHVFMKIVPGSIARYRTQDYLVQLICCVLLFFLCLDFFRTRQRMRIATVLLGLTTIFLVILAYYQEYSQPQRFDHMYGIYELAPDYVGPYYSSFINQNHYGGFLALASFFFFASVLYYLETWDGKFKLDFSFISNAFFLIILPIILASIFDAMARAALIMEFVGLFIIAALGPPSKYRIRVLVTLCIVVLLFFMFLVVSQTANTTRFFFTSLFSARGWEPSCISQACIKSWTLAG